MIFTIGYGGLKRLDELVNVMEERKVDCLLDVRSKPTAWCNDFAGHTMKKRLGPRYRWVGDILGGLGEILEINIQALVRDGRYRTLLLMCAEKDPARCHRHYEIARRLMDYGVVAIHIVNLQEFPADKVPIKEGGLKWLS